MERAQHTHTEEFYEIVEFSPEVVALNRELLAWEQTYNTIRPHQALGYLTLQQFLHQWQRQRKEAKCHQSTDECTQLTYARLIIKLSLEAKQAGWPPRKGRKVRAPPSRVLGNAQEGRPYGKWHRNYTASGPDFVGARARVKSGGKSARLTVATQRRLNPTWSKAK